MMLEDVLRKALVEPIGRDEALYLLKKTTSWDKIVELFRAASKVRDDEVGAVFKFDGFIGMITPCTTTPPCRYCLRASQQGSFQPLSDEEIELGARFIVDTGSKRVGLGGGTYWQGAGGIVIKAVEIVKRSAPKLEIGVDVGPCLTREDLLKLKELGVKEAGASFETINREAFAYAKPGDSLEARLKLAEWIEEVGLGLTSVMIVGLPKTSYEDYVDYILFISKFSSLRRGHFCITGFKPIHGTPFENEPMASSVEVAKVGAVARLILRKCDISFGAMMNDPKLLPLWIMAGTNRADLLGAISFSTMIDDPLGIIAGTNRVIDLFDYGGEVTIKRQGRLVLVNMLSLTTRIAKQLGLAPDVEL